MQRLHKIIKTLKLKKKVQSGERFSACSGLFPEFSIFFTGSKIIAYKGMPAGDIGVTFPTIRGVKRAERLPLKELPKAKRTVRKISVKHENILQSYVIKEREKPEKEIIAHKKVERYVDELVKKGIIPYFCVPRMLGFEIDFKKGKGTLVLEPIVGIPLSRVDFMGLDIPQSIELLRIPVRLMASLHKGLSASGKRIWLSLNDPRFKNIIVSEEFFAGKKPKVFFIDFEKSNLKSSQKKSCNEEMHDLFVFLGDLGFKLGLRVGKSSILKTDEKRIQKTLEIVKSLLEEYFKKRFNIKKIDAEKMKENIKKIIEFTRKKYGRIEDMQNITIKMAMLLLKSLKY